MGRIRKPNELEVNVRVKMLIYGSPGIGKTTLALSAKSPLLFDFDGGVNRVNYQHITDTLQVESYEEFLDVLNHEDLSAYETLVIDTGGKMLDMMGDYLVKTNPKLGRKNGALTRDGYTARKTEFQGLVKTIIAKRKDVIFVAHRTDKTVNDEVRYEPLFGGKNYEALAQDLDLVGYAEADGNKRVITFEQTGRNEGKNTCNLPEKMDIPVVVDNNGNPIRENNFVDTEIISKFRNRLIERSKEGEAYKILIDQINKAIENVKNEEDANLFVEYMQGLDHIGNSREVTRKKFLEVTNSLHLIYNNATKQYEKAS